MAKVTAPFMSMDASGTLAGAITAKHWRGINVMCRHFIPKMGTHEAQVNIRIAVALAMAYWIDTELAAHGAAWTTAAQGMKMSGVNLYMSKALKAYVLMHTPSKAPTGVTLTGTPPNPEFTWTEEA